eukprot:16059218-Heterocapsa_arctica.AAC.1
MILSCHENRLRVRLTCKVHSGAEQLRIVPTVRENSEVQAEESRQRVNLAYEVRRNLRRVT